MVTINATKEAMKGDKGIDGLPGEVGQRGEVGPDSTIGNFSECEHRWETRRNNVTQDHSTIRTSSTIAIQPVCTT